MGCLYFRANKDYFGKVFFHPVPSNPPLLKTPTTAGLVEEEYEEKEDEELPAMINIKEDVMV